MRFFKLEMETTQHDWKTPGEVLEAYRKHNFKLAPPTWITIAELCSFNTLSKLESVAKQGRDLSPIMPTFLLQDSGEISLVLPGDKESSNPQSKDTLYAFQFCHNLIF